MSEVTMPRLSDTMEEGELARWLKQVGDVVEKGDVLAEIETDKATMDLEAFESGVLHEQLVTEGTMVPIGQPVAVIGEGPPSEKPSSGNTSEAEEPAPEEPEPESEAPESKAPESKAPEKAENAIPEDDAPVADVADVADVDDVDDTAKSEPEAPSPTAGKLRMSPLARKLAHDHDIDLDSLKGTGPDGRIIRADIDAAISAQKDDSGAVAEPREALAQRDGGHDQGEGEGDDQGEGDDEVIPLSKIRKVISRRLTQSQEIPHFFLTSVVDVDRLIALRADANSELAEQGIKVSLNDFIVKAVAIALRQHPEANTSFTGDSIVRHRRVNVGIAVATDAGLLVPVVTDADQKSVSQIGAEVVALANTARGGKLTLDQMSGGTFSVSNLGMFGIEEFTAMLNPPEAGILAVGAASPEIVLRDGEVTEAQKMKITLTVDHRAMDGATAAAFLRDLKGILQQPMRILV